MEPQRDCDHKWMLEDGGFVCARCGEQEGVHLYLDRLEARRRIDWKARLIGKNAAAEADGPSWTDRMLDAVQGHRGAVRW